MTQLSSESEDEPEEDQDPSSLDSEPSVTSGEPWSAPGVKQRTAISVQQSRKVSHDHHIANMLRGGTYTIRQLHDRKFTAAELRAYGWPSTSLRSSHLYTIPQLCEAGFRPTELKAAGLSARTLVKAGISAVELLAARFPITALRRAKLTAAELRTAGASTAALAAGGYSAAQCLQAGCPLGELKQAGFDPSELHAAGFSYARLRGAGFEWHALLAYCDELGVRELRRIGYLTGSELRRCFEAHPRMVLDEVSGVTLDELRVVGVSALQLWCAGVTEAALQHPSAGFSTTELRLAFGREAHPRTSHEVGSEDADGSRSKSLPAIRAVRAAGMMQTRTAHSPSEPATLRKPVQHRPMVTSTTLPPIQNASQPSGGGIRRF